MLSLAPVHLHLNAAFANYHRLDSWNLECRSVGKNPLKVGDEEAQNTDVRFKGMKLGGGRLRAYLWKTTKLSASPKTAPNVPVCWSDLKEVGRRNPGMPITRHQLTVKGLPTDCATDHAGPLD
ncbi:hypothetical protein J6590_029928 [Homalodisca vitripennis]|nr:hypothetical protein J6590_029928 [Homalodisca vitripennis]